MMVRSRRNEATPFIDKKGFEFDNPKFCPVIELQLFDRGVKLSLDSFKEVIEKQEHSIFG